MPDPKKRSLSDTVNDIRAFNRERLGAAIRAAEIDIQDRASGASAAKWPAAAHDHLGASRKLWEVGQIDQGWIALKAALRETIQDYSETELRIAARRLRSESEAKLHGWRQETVDSVTGAVEDQQGSADVQADLRGVLDELSSSPEPDAAGSETIARQRYTELTERIASLLEARRPAAEEQLFRMRLWVTEAQEVVDGHHDNVYHRQRLLARQLFNGTLMLAIVLVIVIALILLGLKLEDTQQAFRDGQPLLLLASLGAMGAALSGLLNLLATDKSKRIPDVRAQRHLVWLRPVVGAAAAIVSVGALVAVGQIGGASTAPQTNGESGVALGLYAIAFVAGFSEQFVTRAVASASDALEQ